MVREVVKEFQDIIRVKFDILLEDGPFNPDLAEDVLPKLYLTHSSGISAFFLVMKELDISTITYQMNTFSYLWFTSSSA